MRSIVTKAFKQEPNHEKRHSVTFKNEANQGHKVIFSETTLMYMVVYHQSSYYHRNHFDL